MYRSCRWLGFVACPSNKWEWISDRHVGCFQPKEISLDPATRRDHDFFEFDVNIYVNCCDSARLNFSGPELQYCSINGSKSVPRLWLLNTVSATVLHVFSTGRIHRNHLKSSVATKIWRWKSYFLFVRGFQFCSMLKRGIVFLFSDFGVHRKLFTFCSLGPIESVRRLV